MNASEFFTTVNQFPPRAWQSKFASEPECVDRMIPVGTGLGKTRGLATAWAFNRLCRKDESWPRRLVWCLPMRVLVEQTADEIDGLMTAISEHLSTPAPKVHVLMGGVQTEDWHLDLESPAVLVGTQDMLLSRALNRGYAAGRGRWPIDFAILNQDCLWVFDEVQLQGVGAVTGAQLQAFRDQESRAGHSMRPCRTWWASATLRKRWLATVDSESVVSNADGNRVEVSADDKKLDVFSAKKPLSVHVQTGKISDKATVNGIVDLIAERHRSVQPQSQGRVTLVVVNRVRDAREIDGALRKRDDLDGAEVCLIHSRFRGTERAGWRDGSDKQSAILNRRSCEDSETNRIIVSTQVVEAGVDISASCLITENAPWASLVQRFGRAARYGGEAPVIVIDRKLDEKNSLPYQVDELSASLVALSQLSDVGLVGLSEANERWSLDVDFDAQLFRLDYKHLFMRRDLDELFDTSTDLTGDDIDVSRFIREGEDNSIRVCWYARPETDDDPKKWSPPRTFQPKRESLCPAPIGEVISWLVSAKMKSHHRDNCDESDFAFRWSYEDARWEAIRRKDQITRGQILLVDYRCGGYTNEVGFSGESQKVSKKYSGVPDPVDFATEEIVSTDSQYSDSGQQLDPISQTDTSYISIADHGVEVGELASKIGNALGLDESACQLLDLVGRWHDYGKCHPVFRGNLSPDDDAWANREDIAKAPQGIWASPLSRQYNHPELNQWREDTPHGRRVGFRHELASMLGVLEIVARSDTSHDAVSTGELASCFPTVERDPKPANEIVREWTSLSQEDINLALYLLASHHGKVRCGLHMTVEDQNFRPPQVPTDIAAGNRSVAVEEMVKLPVRGVLTGDVLPAIQMPLSDGSQVTLPEVTLHTDLASMGMSGRYGASWAQRTHELRTSNGIFMLAMLEAIVRAADVIVSRNS